METPKAPDTARGEMILIGKSVVIKGELSCGEDLYVDGQVEGTIDPKGNRLTIGPNGRVKANVTACAVVVQGKLEGNIQASDRVDLKQSAVVMGDIATHRISIDEGAYFKGSLNIQNYAASSRMAPRTLSATSGGISVMLWAVRACSAACCMMSSVVSPFATKSQSIPTSLQLTVFAMVILL